MVRFITYMSQFTRERIFPICITTRNSSFHLASQIYGWYFSFSAIRFCGKIYSTTFPKIWAFSKRHFFNEHNFAAMSTKYFHLSHAGKKWMPSDKNIRINQPGRNSLSSSHLKLPFYEPFLSSSPPKRPFRLSTKIPFSNVKCWATPRCFNFSKFSYFLLPQESFEVILFILFSVSFSKVPYSATEFFSFTLKI